MLQLTTLQEVEAALEPFMPSKLKRFAYTTEYVEQFMEYVGDPQNTPRSVHVAGTSGKTSTAYYAASLLMQSGKKVGLMVSPHAETINERVQINLIPLEESVFCQEFSIFLDIVKQSGMLLTYAEILYAFAYWEFARQHVEYIVVEVGMGGLLDATNVIDRPDKVCIITDIGIDHTNVLGETLEEITAHKAGIIHLHNAVFTHPQDARIMNGIREVCRRNQADLHIYDEPDEPLNLRFLPLFQRRNFALALSAIEFILDKEDAPALSESQMLAAAHELIPARMEIIEEGTKIIILDGAHNPQKLRALCESIQDYFPKQRAAVLVAFSGGRGRKIEQLLTELVPLTNHMIITGMHDNGVHIVREVDEVFTAAKTVRIKSVEAIADQEAAYKALLKRPEPILVITGSIYLISQIRQYVKGTRVQQ